MATTTLQAAYKQAQQLLETNDPERAIAVAQHILEFFPDNLEAYRILGEAYLASRQFDLAQTALQRVIASDPESIPAHFGLGLAFERQGNMPEAVHEFEKALEIKPDMPELRSQLIRLYNEAEGGDNAQLRLTRPGLARLYARGQMWAQAIQEFRDLQADHKDRLDVHVGLAESLWMDGQHAESAEVSREILQRYPHALKPNLLLGYYMLQEERNPEGERYWQIARQLDPFDTVARTMFNPLPDVADPVTELPEWDEAVWQEQQRGLVAADAPSATTDADTDNGGSINVAGAGAALAAGGAALAAGAALGGSDTDAAQTAEAGDTSDPSMDDFFAAMPGNHDASPPPPAAPPAMSADDDAFLASLLGLPMPNSTPEPAPAPASESDAFADDLGVAPFSFDDLTASDSPDAAAEAPAIGDATPQADDAGDAGASGAAVGVDDAAFALDLEGLDAAFRGEDVAPAGDATPQADDAGASGATVAGGDDAPTPFSLEELGLSADEIDQLGLGTVGASGTEGDAGAATTATPDETSALSDEPAKPDEPEVSPLSLAELGLSPEEIALLGGAGAAGAAGIAAFAGQQDEVSDMPAADASDNEAATLVDPDDVAPLSLAELGLSPEDIAALDDLSTTASQVNASDEDALAFADDNAVSPDITPFSFDFDDTTSTAASPDDTPPTPDAMGIEGVSPLSLAELGLSPEEIAALDDLNATTADAVPATDEGLIADSIEPFSFDDFGLDDLSDSSSSEASPFDAAAARDDALGAGDDVKPFSLDDLDLSDLGSNPMEGDTLPPSLQPFSLDDISPGGLDSLATNMSDMSLPPENAEDSEDISNAGFSWQVPAAKPAPDFATGEEPPVEEASQRGSASIFARLKQRRDALPPVESEPLSDIEPGPDEMRFFSNDDVSLRDAAAAAAAAAAGRADERQAEEAADAGATDTTQPPAPTGATAGEVEMEVAPLSLEELGLSPEEIAALNELNTEGTEGIAVDGMGARDTSDDVPPTPDEPAEVPPVAAAPEPPALEPEPAADEPVPDEGEPEITPLSLEELGLSPEEIAALNAMSAEGASGMFDETFADESVAEDVPAAAAEPPVAPEPVAPEPVTGEGEPEIMPLSLEELGLSPEEIAALNAANMDIDSVIPDAPPTDTSASFDELSFDEPSAAPEPPAAAKPQSLADLGLDFSGEDGLSFDSLSGGAAESGTGDTGGFDFDDVGLQPFSLDELHLTDQLPDGSGGDANRLGLTADELAGMDFEPSGLGGDTGAQKPAAPTPVDPVEQLIMTGREQGQVELMDIIRLVDNPEEEPEKVMEIAWRIYSEGVQIYDQGEILDLEAELEEGEAGEAVAESPTAADEPHVQPSSPARPIDEPRVTRQLSPDELTEADPPVVPLSLEELGLSADEIAQLGLAEEGAMPAPAPEAEASAEPDVAPLSLEELGLSADEIAQLGLAVDHVTPEADEAPPVQPEVRSVDFGLTSDELVRLSKHAKTSGGSGAMPTMPPTDTGGASGAGEPQEDMFDFSMAEEAEGRVERTAPRRTEKVEAPPAPPSAEDLAFVPESLETLDDIWDAPVTEPEEDIGRLVLPPLAERRQEATGTAARSRPAPARRERDTSRRGVARRVEADRGDERDRRRRRNRADELTDAPAPAPTAAPVPAPVAASAPAPTAAPSPQPAETGNAMLDEFIKQANANPTNNALRLGVARLALQAGEPEVAMQMYRSLVTSGDDQAVALLVSDLQDVIPMTSDPTTVQRLYRLLGDGYTHQKRFQEAMTAYTFTP